jgi:hypothetical protein
VSSFPGNRKLNCDTGFQRFQPVLAIFHLQSTQFATMNAPRTGPEARVTIMSPVKFAF